MNRIPTIIEAICVILHNLKSIEKIHLVKLIYLADKYHLMNYGRTITGDDFFAFPNGPGGSITIDVLDYDSYVLGNYLDYAHKMFKNDKEYNYVPGEDCSDISSLEMLSESDIEALNFSINRFGKMGQWNVVDYTHELPEWKPLKQKFKRKEITREPLKLEDLLLRDQNDKYFTISQKHINKSREIIQGKFD